MLLYAIIKGTGVTAAITSAGISSLKEKKYSLENGATAHAMGENLRRLLILRLFVIS